MFLRPAAPPVAVVVSHYDDLRAAIGGPVRAVRLSAEVVCYVREHLAGEPINPTATGLAVSLAEKPQIAEPIRGVAVVFGCVSPEGEWDGLEYDCPTWVWDLAITGMREHQRNDSKKKAKVNDVAVL